MRKFKVIINFSRMTIPEFIEFARNIVTKMKENANYDTPDVSFDLLSATINSLETKYNAAQNGGKQQTADMNQTRKYLENIMRKQGLYIERIADGNEVIILSSGYHASKQPIASAQNDFIVKNGDHEGEMILRHKSIRGAAAWVWQICTDPVDDAKWAVTAYSTQASIKVNELKQGAKHWFRCAYISKEGLSPWCNPIAKIVV